MHEATLPALPEPKSKLPLLPFAVFDEFGKSADDRVQDYGFKCAEAARAEERAKWQAELDAANERIKRILEGNRQREAELRSYIR